MATWQYEISASGSAPNSAESVDDVHCGETGGNSHPGPSGSTHAALGCLNTQQIRWRTGDGLGKPRLIEDLSIVHHTMQV